LPPSPVVRLSWPDAALLARLPDRRRCLSSAALNGGLAAAGHWLALQVAPDELDDDPALRLAEAAIAHGLDPRAVVGTVTTADVRAGVRRDHGPATAVATVGADVAVLLAIERPLGDGGLVAALQAATTAAADALAATRLRGADRHGDASTSGRLVVCVTAPAGERPAPRGPSGATAASLTLAVHGAVRSGARIHQRTRRALGEV
jgi:adenosylcobinamide amidohydrolase